MMLVDVHRHLGGSLSVSFVWQTISKLRLKYLAESEFDVRQQLTFTPHERRDFHRFLDKFRILDEIPWTEELIDASVKSVCDGLEAEGIDYAWIDFSVNKYMRIGWHRHTAIRFVKEAFERHRKGRVGLILALKYESMLASQRRYAKLIERSDVFDNLIGLDLVGDEIGEFNPKFHEELLKPWRNTGKIIRAHVGESGPASNVTTMIKAGATNIAHGIKIAGNLDIVKLALERNVTFDLGLTSNILTGVATRANHPIMWMIEMGLPITIGTDDPVICNTTLRKEYALCRKFGLTEEHIKAVKRTAISRTVGITGVPDVVKDELMS